MLALRAYLWQYFMERDDDVIWLTQLGTLFFWIYVSFFLSLCTNCRVAYRKKAGTVTINLCLDTSRFRLPLPRLRTISSFNEKRPCITYFLSSQYKRKDYLVEQRR